jgi:hypothetical protein
MKTESMNSFVYILLLNLDLLVFFTRIQAQDYSAYKTKYFDPMHQALTYCNPINIDYNFEFFNHKSVDTAFRTTADPVIVFYQEDYYLFSTNQSGFYWSSDLGTWNFVYSAFQRLPGTDDQCAPAAWVMNDTLFYVGSTYYSLPVWYTTNPKAGRWQHYVDSTRLPAWDPAYFYDDNRKLYLYYGSSGTLPLKGVEIDKQTFLPVGEPSAYKKVYETNNIQEKQEAVGEIKEVIALDPETHGWERFGMNNDHPNAPWGHFIEGAWMNKYRGKYYLQYGAPGTEFKVYADGVYTADHPLGPFTYQPHNPFAYKPGGFVMGCGHGNTFSDAYGNYWHTGTAMISVKYKFERRIGLYPAGFDTDGVLYTNTAFGDYPTYLPTALRDHQKTQHTGWMLLSFQKELTASSSDENYLPHLAADEDIRTFWSAQSEKPGEWLCINLGRKMQVHAFQVNYADHKANQRGKAMDLYHQYRIYGSNNQSDWELIVDKTYNDRDIPHDYIELTEPASFQYFKLENQHMATGMFALSDFRLFGFSTDSAPEPVQDFTVQRSKSDSRNAIISWNAHPNAYGFNIYFGVAPDKLYNCITVNGASTYDFRGMNRDATYYFSIEALSESGISPRTLPLKVE